MNYQDYWPDGWVGIVTPDETVIVGDRCVFHMKDGKTVVTTREGRLIAEHTVCEFLNKYGVKPEAVQ